MKRYFLLLSVALVLSGCGVDWFPSNSASTNSPNLSMSINSSAIAVGASTVLTFTIINAAGTAQTGLGFTDTLPTGLTVSPTSASQCGGGTVTVTGTTLTFASGIIAANTTSCTVTASVTGTTAGTYSLKSTDITGLNGGLVNKATDQSLVVSSPTLNMLITTNPVASNVATNFTFIITNSSGSPAQTGLGFTENLPANLTVFPTSTTQCGGTVAATGTPTTGMTLSLTGGSIASGTTNCTVTASVTGASAGSFVIPISTGLSAGLVNNTTSQTLTVN